MVCVWEKFVNLIHVQIVKSVKSYDMSSNRKYWNYTPTKTITISTNSQAGYDVCLPNESLNLFHFCFFFLVSVIVGLSGAQTNNAAVLRQFFFFFNNKNYYSLSIRIFFFFFLYSLRTVGRYAFKLLFQLLLLHGPASRFFFFLRPENVSRSRKKKFFFFIITDEYRDIIKWPNERFTMFYNNTQLEIIITCTFYVQSESMYRGRTK